MLLYLDQYSRSVASLHRGRRAGASPAPRLGGEGGQPGPHLLRQPQQPLHAVEAPHQHVGPLALASFIFHSPSITFLLGSRSAIHIQVLNKMGRNTCHPLDRTATYDDCLVMEQMILSIWCRYMSLMCR